MNNAYILGVAAAILAGLAFNLGLIIQKLAINRTDPAKSLMRQILRNPTWLGGFALQFFIGSPLNMLAAAKIGPILLPGLMAIGLIVLAVGAVRLAHEKFNRVDAIGIFLIVAATAILPFSQLGIDMKTTDFSNHGLVSRLIIFTAVVAALIFICHLLQLRYPHQRSSLLALNSGLCYVESNLWIGAMMGFFEDWLRGEFSWGVLGGLAAACAISAVGSFMGIANIQRAFQCGDATRVVPIQNAPPQILAFAPYVLIFNLKPPSPLSFPIAAVAVVLIIIGSGLLAQRQVSLNVQKPEPYLEQA